MDVGAFMWQLDREAMNVLQSMGPLRSAAHAISERFGRPWFEAALNGVRLGEDQMPGLFRQAIYAARVVGLPFLPEIYVSGEEMWNSKTLGSDAGAFVSLGTVLLNFKGDDLLFLLGREMGHAAAGHALWRTVLEFVSGRQAQRTIMGQGVAQFLNPAKLLESAVDAPLMAWARHSEITADRAGLLVVGKEDVARRVLLQWALKSFPVYQQISQEAWLRQEEQSDTSMTRLSEWTLANTPYVAPRLKLMREFAQSPELLQWRKVIEYWGRDALPPPVEATVSQKRAAPRPGRPDTVRLICAACREPMRVPRATFQGTDSVKIRCPNAKCRQVLDVRPRSASPSPETLAPDA